MMMVMMPSRPQEPKKVIYIWKDNRSYLSQDIKTTDVRYQRGYSESGVQ